MERERRRGAQLNEERLGGDRRVIGGRRRGREHRRRDYRHDVLHFEPLLERVLEGEEVAETEPAQFRLFFRVVVVELLLVGSGGRRRRLDHVRRRTARRRRVPFFSGQRCRFDSVHIIPITFCFRSNHSLQSSVT